MNCLPELATGFVDEPLWVEGEGVREVARVVVHLVEVRSDEVAPGEGVASHFGFLQTLISHVMIAFSQTSSFKAVVNLILSHDSAEKRPFTALW